ncbi:MAG: hypothetical protein ACLP01_19365 [Solirubrobacteraceae bacterium]
MTILPDFEQQLVDLAARTYGSDSHRRPRSLLRRSIRALPGAIVPAAAVTVSVIIALAAILLLRSAHHHPAVRTAAGERALLAEYAVLRRPQTAADRQDSGPAPSLAGGRRGFGASGGRPGGGSFYYRVRITGLAHYQDVPELTRVVLVDGLSVSLFVEHLVPSDTLPKATVTGNDPQAAAQRTTRQRLETLQRSSNSQPAYTLWARIGRSGQAQLIATSPARSRQFAPGTPGANLLPAPGGRMVAVVPDDVARLSWGWPREFDSAALRFVPRVTVSAMVHDNIAVAPAPARFSSVDQIDPETVVLYAANATVIASSNNPSNSASVYLGTTWDGSTPGPETALSRRAERDPATPNRVVLVPSVVTRKSVTLGPGPQLFFNVLLNHRNYFLRLTGGPRPGCITANPQDPSGPGYGEVLQPGAEPTVRGDTYLDGGPLGVIKCSGTYRFSISVLNEHDKPYPPFGSASFTVR